MSPRLALPALAPRDRRALRLGAWLLLPALLAVVVRPWAASLLDERAAVARERALLGRELRLVADAPRERERLAEATHALSAAAARLFEGEESVTASAELARYVAAKATASGLALERSSTESPLDDGGRGGDAARDSAGGGALRVTVRARGDVVAVVTFLETLEGGPMLVRVERMAIGQASAEGEEAAGTLSLVATVVGLARASFAPESAAPARPAVTFAMGEVAGADAPPDGAEGELVSDPFSLDHSLPGDAAATDDAAPAADGADSAPAAAVRLLGTVVRGTSGGFALCQLAADAPRVVHVGERLGGLVLVTLEQGRAVFRAPNGTRLELSLSTPGT